MHFAIFAWNFACVDFHGKINKTKVCRNCDQGNTWNLNISCLSLKPTKSFEPRNTIKTVFFLFPFEVDPNSWGVDSAKKPSRKRLGKPKKFLRDTGRHLCCFANLFPVLFDRFVVFTSCILHLEVSRQKRQNAKPYPDGKFFVNLNLMDWEFYAMGHMM